MAISEDKIDEVRRASDIVDVISSYLPLKKRGKSYLGLCPFHGEKTPSFNVSAEKQMYHCFGCGAGGNVFTFVMNIEKVSFVESVRTLAERAGIVIPEREADKAQATENEGLYEACKAAGLHFHENMSAGSEGKIALEYFRHRGFSEGTIRKFGLGYSRNTWDDLVQFIRAKQADPLTYEKAGLILKRDDGSYYDRFRGRCMFPLFSPTGRTIGFGARKLREDDPLGKYINSPETPIFNKSRNLYGLHQAREALRDRGMAIMVEGYADLISVYQAGIENIVASSGTALTEEQIHLIGRYAKSIVLVYDGDSAGSAATARGAELVIEQGLDVSIATLPSGEDPDSFVRKQGKEAFAALVAGAVSFLDFKAESFRTAGMLQTPEGKTQAVRSLVQTISKVKDEIKRTFMVQSVAERYGLYESLLFKELDATLGHERDRSRFAARREEARRPAPAPVPEIRQPKIELPPSERDLVRVMAEAGSAMAEFVFSHITPEHFTHPLARRAADTLKGLLDGGSEWDAARFISVVADEELQRFVADTLATRYEISRGWTGVDAPDLWTIAEDCIIRHWTTETERAIADNFRLLKEARDRHEDVTPYMEENIRLQSHKKQVQQTRLLEPPDRSQSE
jgi:DNA primase